MSRRDALAVVRTAALACGFLAAGPTVSAQSLTPVLLRPVTVGHYSSAGFGLDGEAVALGSTLYFAGADGFSDFEPWKSDGTPEGTARLADIYTEPGVGSSPDRFTVAGDKVFFLVRGRQLWVTDGTAAGTRMVKNFSVPYAMSLYLGALGDTLFVGANVGAETGLWKSDGTEAGTVLVKAFDRPTGLVSYLTAIGTTLYFAASDGVHGQELWKSDGTAAGTTLVLDVYPGAQGSFPHNISAAGDTVFFSANDGVHGHELWGTDGTGAGTALVLDIRPGWETSDPSGVLEVGDALLFRADDGTSGMELWRTDGTGANTALMADINPGGASSAPQSLTMMNGEVYFIAGDGVHGRELWRCDGTASGTRLVVDLNPGAGDARISWLTAVNGRLFFSAYELWVSNGTAEGTVVLLDRVPGLDASDPSPLVGAGTTLFFSVWDSVPGPTSRRELWKVVAEPAPPFVSRPGALVVGEENTLAGSGFTAGSVIMLFVATASGAVSHGPFTPSSWSPTALAWTIPAEVPLGRGFAAVQVVNTDLDREASNVVPALLVGSATAGIPSIMRIDGAALAPAQLAVGLAHVDTVVSPGAAVTIEGAGFTDPVVNVFTAAGNIGPLTPVPGGTATAFQVLLPSWAPTGPGNFQVVNRPSYRVSNAVSSVLGAVPTVTSVSAAGATITVTGTGFCTLSVINLYNLQDAGVVNLGGLGPGGAARIPLALLSDTQFTFPRPAGAVDGPAFVEVLNPPFIPYASSGNDPDGAFSMPAAPPP
jgi:ELWxxDGT repeat protein